LAGSALGALLSALPLVGIRNAWDLVTWLAPPPPGCLSSARVRDWRSQCPAALATSFGSLV
jgi:hypothetical protein